MVRYDKQFIDLDWGTDETVRDREGTDGPTIDR